MVDTRFQGVVLTARHGELLDVACSGFADRDAELLCTPQTRSPLASVSKQFAAVVALLLVDRGVIELDDSVRRHLPDAPAQWNDVSLRQLMTHTAGISHWSDEPGFVPSTPMDPAERLALLLRSPLITEPGTEWRYSSPGYIVLAGALAAAARTPYSQLVTELIIDELDLRSTAAGEPKAATAAQGYRAGERVDPWQLHSMPGTGDIWSSATDLLRFLTALHSGALLPPPAQQTFRELRVPLPNTSPATDAIRTSAYGCGSFFGTIHGADARLHPGDNPGYLSLAAWLPESRTVVVALSNDETSDIETAVAEAAVSAASR